MSKNVFALLTKIFFLLGGTWVEKVWVPLFLNIPGCGGKITIFISYQFLALLFPCFCRLWKKYFTYKFQDKNTVELGFNDHGFNKFTAITNKYNSTFLVFYYINHYGYTDLTAITSKFSWSRRACYNRVGLSKIP